MCLGHPLTKRPDRVTIDANRPDPARHEILCAIRRNGNVVLEELPGLPVTARVSRLEQQALAGTNAMPFQLVSPDDRSAENRNDAGWPHRCVNG